MLLVDGNPVEDVSVMADWKNNTKVIVKDGKVYKDTLWVLEQIMISLGER